MQKINIKNLEINELLKNNFRKKGKKKSRDVDNRFRIKLIKVGIKDK